ncbi:NOT2 / NOT3 / NOT5 family protein [Dictyocaulus viviparus]|uniref:NOT2 / NOT3 / NOT5 family protein n=1 Tax=Dictyocaulus viviparus TaxID=29172 RepID=A0A0D8XT88_DICVI|nr:NOT2 / NOT3 / NOT5 family protein [Dictyocaulus viviparus]
MANGKRSNADNSTTLMRGVDASLNNPEFQIQNEDFPALPGSSPGDHPAQAPASLWARIQMTVANDMPMSSTAASDPFGVRPAGETARGIITHPDGEVSNIPPTMLADQFGMAGLVTYLRTVDNPSIVSLALGYDLTTLGLNLNLSERHLYTSFGGPWADNPIRPHELDVKVPDDYLTNAQIRDKLPPVKLNKLSEDVLFYFVYNCPGEVYQLAAACELYQRDWRFHKTDGNWLTRSQYGGVKEQTGSYEKGQYNVFDPLQWRKIPKELKLEYKELEERPKLPAMFGGGGGGGGATAPSMNASAPRPAS